MQSINLILFSFHQKMDDRFIHIKHKGSLANVTRRRGILTSRPRDQIATVQIRCTSVRIGMRAHPFDPRSAAQV
jgi:hypothetical protein